MTDYELKQLSAYSDALDNLAKNNSNDTFPNKDHKHASIVLSKILKYSKSTFILFDDDLKGDIVKNDQVVSFRDSLIEFISRGGSLKIVISDENDDDDASLKSFLKTLVELFSEQVELKLASSEFKESMKKIYGEKINFAVGDTNKYRLEKYGDNSVDKKTGTAIGSFNNEQTSRLLLKAFYFNYNSCLSYN